MQTNASFLMHRLWRDYIRHQRARLVVAVLAMAVVAGATAANAWMMGPVLDDVFIRQNSTMLIFIPLMVFAISVINAVAHYVQMVWMRYVGQRIVADMQQHLFSHLMRSDLGLFHDQGAGRLVSRFTNDIQMMRASVSNVMTGLIKEILTLICLIGVMLHRSWELSIVAFVVFPAAIYPIIRLGRSMRRLAERTQEQLGDFTAQLDEIFQGARTVKAYNREPMEITRANTTIEALFKTYAKTSRKQAMASPMMELLTGAAIALVIWYGGQQVLSGETTPGSFVSFITAFIMAYRPMKAIAGLSGTLQEGLAAATRFFAVLDSKPKIVDAPDARVLLLNGGGIRFEHVTFRYDGGNGVENIEIDVPAGKTAALVGLSGGGKSTLMNLLLRFYEVEKGSISIDGQDIRKVTLASLRDAMAFVPQDPMLFDDSVRANIAYGNMRASEEDIRAAAKAAAADEFIAALSEGYDTLIGPHGVKLSGGQRQRLAIARAMLKNAPILLLDEATSALDNESERAVQDALARLMQGRTTLVIAHRLSTIMHADVIYVIDAGKVVESGTHSSLLEARGKYYQLYAAHSL